MIKLREIKSPLSTFFVDAKVAEGSRRGAAALPDPLRESSCVLCVNTTHPEKAEHRAVAKQKECLRRNPSEDIQRAGSLPMKMNYGHAVG